MKRRKAARHERALGARPTIMALSLFPEFHSGCRGAANPHAA